MAANTRLIPSTKTAESASPRTSGTYLGLADLPSHVAEDGGKHRQNTGAEAGDQTADERDAEGDRPPDRTRSQARASDSTLTGRPACRVGLASRSRTAAQSTSPKTIPSGATKNEVGMYWNVNFDASCSADASSVIAFTKTTLSCVLGDDLVGDRRDLQARLSTEGVEKHVDRLAGLARGLVVGVRRHCVRRSRSCEATWPSVAVSTRGA